MTYSKAFRRKIDLQQRLSLIGQDFREREEVANKILATEKKIEELNAENQKLHKRFEELDVRIFKAAETVADECMKGPIDWEVTR